MENTKRNTKIVTLRTEKVIPDVPDNFTRKKPGLVNFLRTGPDLGLVYFFQSGAEQGSSLKRFFIIPLKFSLIITALN
jgi:hypothetical protein